MCFEQLISVNPCFSPSQEGYEAVTVSERLNVEALTLTCQESSEGLRLRSGSTYELYWGPCELQRWNLK